jgi:hypothetical protein
MASELAFEIGSVVVVSLVPDALPDMGDASLARYGEQSKLQKPGPQGMSIP